MVVRWIEDHSIQLTVKMLQIVFSEFGIPCTLVTDRGSNFMSTVFTDFCNNLDIIHKVTSTYHHQSNFTERGVQTVKKLMKKCGENWQSGLLEYLCTPIDNTLNHPPSQLLAGRNFHGLIPQVNPIRIERDMEDTLQRSEKIYPDLNNPKSKFILIPEGASMMTYNHIKKFWIPGTVERRLSDDVSYMVRLSDGTLVNCNRVDLKMSKIPFK